MPKCQQCGDEFPNRVKVNGKTKNLSTRRYCLRCSPFGSHNTRKLGSDARRNRPEIGDINEEGLIYSDVYGGHPRWMRQKVCANPECGRDFLAPKHRDPLFCCRSCASHMSRNQVRSTCPLCGKEFDLKRCRQKYTKTGQNFCSRACKEAAQSIKLGLISPPHYKDGRSSYRRRAILHYGPECSECRYNKDDRMLDVHHIDQDRSNNELDNLLVLCVWCHAERTRAGWPRLF